MFSAPVLRFTKDLHFVFLIVTQTFAFIAASATFHTNYIVTISAYDHIDITQIIERKKLIIMMYMHQIVSHKC